MLISDDAAVWETVKLTRPASGAWPVVTETVATAVKLEEAERVLKLSGFCNASKASLKPESLDWKLARALILRLEVCSLLSISVTGFCSTAINWLTMPATSIVDPLVEADELVDEMAMAEF